jgi:dihydrofolate reductase
MTKVTFDISMSLDGFITANGSTAEEPMGKGGERLHEWAFGADEESRRLLEEAVGSIGAVIVGRRTYDQSLPWWGADGPTGDARLPVFVVTNDEPDESPEGGVYSFVTGGIEEALARARAAAGERGVTVMGGADVGRQYLSAGPHRRGLDPPRAGGPRRRAADVRGPGETRPRADRRGERPDGDPPALPRRQSPATSMNSA